MNIKLYGTIVSHSIFFIILLCLFFWQGWKCWDLYQKGETSVQMSIKQAGHTRFPAIAISPGWNKSALGILIIAVEINIFAVESLGIQEEAYKDGSNWTSEIVSPDEILK